MYQGLVEHSLGPPIPFINHRLPESNPAKLGGANDFISDSLACLIRRQYQSAN